MWGVYYIIWLSPSLEMLGNAKKKKQWYVCSGFIQAENFQITH